MLARGKRTTTERKKTSPSPSALLDARLKTTCCVSETWRTSPVAFRLKAGTAAPVGAEGTAVSLIDLEPPFISRAGLYGQDDLIMGRRTLQGVARRSPTP